MARTSFYDDNSSRAYPFLRDAPFFSNAAVVACGFMLGPNTGYEQGVHRVSLTQIRRYGQQILFRFECDAPGLTGKSLLFSREANQTAYATSYADPSDDFVASISESASYSETGESVAAVCGLADDFSGFLTTGDLTELLEQLTAAGDELLGDATVEPALLVDLTLAYARSLNLANGDRTRYETPDGCREQCWPVTPQPLYVRSSCLQGHVRFLEGYNVSIRQSALDNSLTFDGLVGGGEGEPCEQVPVFAGETTPDDSVFLEGGPGCGEVLRSINGQGGRVFQIKGGQGVAVRSEPDKHKVVVIVDTQGMAVCAPGTTTDDTDDPGCPDVDYGEDPCDCGPE